MQKPELVLMLGLPAGGKTTEAKLWEAEDPDARIRVNYDDLRLGMFGEDWIWNRKEEEQMKAHARGIVKKALMAGISVVVDNCNLSQHVRASWQDLGRDLGAEYIEQDVSTPLDECIHRDWRRTGKARVGRAVIENMAMRYGYMDLTDKELYPRDFVICDIDGTIANCEHRKHHIKPRDVAHKVDCTFPIGSLPPSLKCPQCGAKPHKDWPAFFKACDADTPIQPIINLLYMFNEYGSPSYDVLFVSGRDLSLAGIKTEDWLERHCVPPYRHLLMRPGSDARPDVDLKREILSFLPKERIAYVIDDRNAVIEMWRKEGLTVLQCAAGDF